MIGVRHIEVERFVALRLTADCIGRAAPNKEGDGACRHRERDEKHDRPGRSDFVPCRPGAEPWQDYRVFDLTRENPMEKPYAAIRDELVMTLVAGGFGEKAAAIVDALEKLIEARIEMTLGR